MTDIAVSTLVQRQTPPSRFSYFEGSWEELVTLVKAHFEQAKPGYRDGVCLVPVPAEGFWSGVVTLMNFDLLVGSYERRQDDEEPRKSVQVSRLFSEEEQELHDLYGKQRAKHVDIVLYRHDVLAENNEQSTEAEWEIISINARITDEEMPMHPSTMMYNHFELSGGTATGWDDARFVAELRKSFTYWRDKAFVTESDLDEDENDWETE